MTSWIEKNMRDIISAIFSEFREYLGKLLTTIKT